VSAQAATAGVAQDLQRTHGELLESAPADQITVSLDTSKPHEAPASYTNLVLKNCPTYSLQLYKESYPTIRLSRTVGAANLGQALLGGTDEPGIVLVGTSYTADPPALGFVPYLSRALGTVATNAAITGGGALSALLDYHSGLKIEEASPQLLL